MNADEDEKSGKSGSSEQANPGAVGAANQPAKQRAATKRTRPAAKSANGGKRRSSEGTASPKIVAARKAFEDLVKTLGGPDAAMKALEAIMVTDSSAARPGGKRSPKRAICLAGGGPAAGLHIGVLQGLKERGIDFDNQDSVWALSCIGAWVGIIYNQAKDGKGLEATQEFFRNVFRDDESFRSFPTNTI